MSKGHCATALSANARFSQGFELHAYAQQANCVSSGVVSLTFPACVYFLSCFEE